MTVHSGSCLCGAVTFDVKGDFDSFYICHCRYCQKGTGSAFAANLFVPAGALTWLSGKETVTSFTLPSTAHRKSFCNVCGSAVPGVEDSGDVLVPAGCLDTEVVIPPTANIFNASRARWEADIAAAPAFDALPES
ncbi:GFA family protein [Gilvimarinus xylanilyticus]|uniref:GFA family protein n=1 Tax=Gilvimarinus xylanilyticus TaxID=2944139 RepID=A0A9X2HXQ6_9GAMM|nr:GFA family protein [Gilvimarinus xylanilyticus]MCP8899599.1 GFA family protein [Gilvimarinus xylanilyticus]